MKVYSRVDPTWIVTKRGYVDGRPAKYRAFPPGDNKIDVEEAFETEEQLADFLSRKPGWKSYFRDPSGTPRNQHVAWVK